MKAVAEKRIPALRICNKAELAEFYEIHISTLDAWIRRGCPIMQRGRHGVAWQFDLLEVAKWRFGTQEQSSEEDPEQMEPKARLDWYKGNRERDAHAKDQGLLIPFDLAEQLVGAAFASVRAGLLSQHNTIASHYPEMSKDAISGILSANRELLTRLSEARLPESIAAALDRLTDKPGAAAGEDGEPVGG